MEKTPKRTSLANGFGTLGYISVSFQWVWSLLLLCYPMIADGSDFFSPQQPITPAAPPVQFSEQLTPLLTVIAVVATILVLGLTVVTLLRLPKMLGKKAGTMSQSATLAVLPVVTRHRKITKKERLRLSYRIMLVLKALLVATPLVLIVFVQPIDQLGTPTMWAIALFAAGCSLGYFLVQQLIAMIGKVAPTDLW